MNPTTPICPFFQEVQLLVLKRFLQVLNSSGSIHVTRKLLRKCVMIKYLSCAYSHQRLSGFLFNYLILNTKLGSFYETDKRRTRKKTPQFNS